MKQTQTLATRPGLPSTHSRNVHASARKKRPSEPKPLATGIKVELARVVFILTSGKGVQRITPMCHEKLFLGRKEGIRFPHYWPKRGRHLDANQNKNDDPGVQPGGRAGLGMGKTVFQK